MKKSLQIYFVGLVAYALATLCFLSFGFIDANIDTLPQKILVVINLSLVGSIVLYLLRLVCRLNDEGLDEATSYFLAHHPGKRILIHVIGYSLTWCSTLVYGLSAMLVARYLSYYEIRWTNILCMVITGFIYGLICIGMAYAKHDDDDGNDDGYEEIQPEPPPTNRLDAPKGDFRFN